MFEIIEQILLSLVDLILPLVSIRIILDFIRIILFKWGD